MITLSGGTIPLKTALGDYQAAWKAFIVINHLEAFEHTIRPTALSWKVAHKVSLYANLRLLGDKAFQIHIATINDRFIAKALLYEPYAGVSIIKIMERRAGSHDELGLDSIDFFTADIDTAYHSFKTAGAHVTKQKNDLHEWLSLRFGKNHEYEAKFMDHTLLDITAEEVKRAQAKLDNHG